MTSLNIIVGLTKDHVIGKDNELPWHIPEDLKNFKKLTLGNVVVMGRKTWDSLPEKFRPLPGRQNVVVSRSMPDEEGIDVCRDIPSALQKAQSYGKEVFIIGGANLYKQTLDLADKLYLSYVKKEVVGDAFFPRFDKDEWEMERQESFEDFDFVIVKRKTSK